METGLIMGDFLKGEGCLVRVELIETIQIGGAVLMTIPCGVIS